MFLMIGDIHGCPIAANNVIEYAERNYINTIIQLGDFGAHWDFDKCILTDKINLNKYEHRWISCLGNHDNYDYLDSIMDRKNDEGLVPYGLLQNSSRVLVAPRNTRLIINGIKFLFFGGAESIDCYHRQEGVSWWRKESPSYMELELFLSNLEDFKPDIVCSHDAPINFRPNFKDLFKGNTLGGVSYQYTSNALQEIYDTSSHKPKKWFYGHYHVMQSVTDESTGTEFICTGHAGNGYVLEEDLNIFKI